MASRGSPVRPRRLAAGHQAHRPRRALHAQRAPLNSSRSSPSASRPCRSVASSCSMVRYRRFWFRCIARAMSATGTESSKRILRINCSSGASVCRTRSSAAWTRLARKPCSARSTFGIRRRRAARRRRRPRSRGRTGAPASAESAARTAPAAYRPPRSWWLVRNVSSACSQVQPSRVTSRSSSTATGPWRLASADGRHLPQFDCGSRETDAGRRPPDRCAGCCALRTCARLVVALDDVQPDLGARSRRLQPR